MRGRARRAREGGFPPAREKDDVRDVSCKSVRNRRRERADKHVKRPRRWDRQFRQRRSPRPRISGLRVERDSPESGR